MDTPHKRRILFKIVPEASKRQLQFEFLKLMVILLLFSIIILSVCNTLIIRIVLSTAELGRYAESQLGSIFAWVSWLSFSVGIILLVIGSILALRFSHRIAGPLYRIEATLKDAIANNKIPEIKIRKDDYLQEFANLLNEFISKNIKK